MKTIHMLAGALIASAAIAGCGGGGSDGNAGTPAAPAVDPTLSALAGLLPSDTAIDADQPLPVSLQSPENLGSASGPDAEEMPPG
jgi:hypothetical protein